MVPESPGAKYTGRVLRIIAGCSESLPGNARKGDPQVFWQEEIQQPIRGLLQGEPERGRRGCISAQKTTPVVCGARESTSFSNLVGIFENPLVAEAVQEPATVTASFLNNKVMDCLPVLEDECCSPFSQAGLTFSAHGPFCPCPSV